MTTPPNRRPGVDASVVQATTVRGYDAPSGAVPPQTPGDLVVSTGLDQTTLAVSNILVWNRTDDRTKPIFVMVPGADINTAPRLNVHAGDVSDPNGIITAPLGSLYVSNNPPAIWQNQNAGTVWKAISDDLGNENLAETLAIGNFTGGTDIVVSNSDSIRGEANSGGAGFALNLIGGAATGAIGAGGNVFVIGGSSVAGTSGRVELLTPTTGTTAASGSILATTGASVLGANSGGLSFNSGNVGAAGLGGISGGVTIGSGRSLSTGVFGAGGTIQILGGSAGIAGQGAYVRIQAGASTASFVPPPLPILAAGRGGDLNLVAGNSSSAVAGGNVVITAGNGGSGGGAGGNVNINPGAGGGGGQAGNAIVNGILRATNIKRGLGDPNGIVPGNEGDIYQRTDVGLGQLWLNTNGSTNGWVRLAVSGDFLTSFNQLQWGYLVPAAKNTGGPADNYAEVGLWKGLTDNTTSGAIETGAELANGPILTFRTGGGINDVAVLDMSSGLGSLPHAMRHKFLTVFQMKTDSSVFFRSFAGFSNIGAPAGPNQLSAVNASPGAPFSYVGFVADTSQNPNWRVVTSDGASVSGPFDTGVPIATVAGSVDGAWYFVIDASLYPASLQFYVFDPSLTLQGSVVVPTTLPAAGEDLGLILGIQALDPSLRRLQLNHATIVNQKGIVGEGGGSSLAGITLAQVLINGNETGINPILLNQGSAVQGVTDDNGGAGADAIFLSGTTTFPVQPSGGMLVGSANRIGVGGTGVTGQVFVSSGAQFDAGSSGDTGDTLVLTGGHAGTGGSTGNLVLATGIHAGTGGSTGDILMAPGTFAPNSATPGDVTIKGGSTNLVGVQGGDVTITTGENSSGNGGTGDLSLESFSVNIAGTSGFVSLATGSGGASGDSGLIFVGSGPAIGGATGNILMATGAAGNGSAGSVSVSVGTSTVGQGSSILLNAGTTFAGGQAGGDVILNPGGGPGGPGAVIVNGKLTVTGLIDPTGLLLSGQTSIPSPVGSGEGLLWIDSTVVPSRLIYVDDVGTQHDISTGGGVTTLSALTDVNIAAPLAGQVLTYNGVQWQNLPGAGGSPLQTILAIGNTTGNLPIVVSDQPLARIVGEADLRLDAGPNPGDQVVINGLRWPQADGLGGWVLTTDGIGNLSFQPGGGGGSESFAEAFARMQWGSAIARLPSGFSNEGILGPVTSVGAIFLSFSNAQGVVSTTTSPGGVGSIAGFEIPASVVRLDSQFLTVLHFDVEPPLGYNFFAGVTTGTATTQTVASPVLQSYVGVELRTAPNVPPETTLHFTTDAATGTPTLFDTGIAPGGLLGFWLTIDATVPSEVTLTLYDNNHVQLAQHTFTSNLPAPTTTLGHVVGIRSIDGAAKTTRMWGTSCITRADLLQALGSGGSQNLMSVLGFGNETGGIPIKGDDNVAGTGTNLELLGGSSTGGGGSGGHIVAQTGSPDPAGNGSGGSFQFTAASGAGTGAGGSLQLQLGDGGATNGTGGSLQIDAGDGFGTGSGGSIQVTAGDGGITSGLAGSLQFTAGDATGGNAIGGNFQFTAGSGFGTGDGGSLQFTAGAGGAGVGGDGGDIIFNPGAAGGGVVGSVEVNGDLHVTGKLTVDGLIDPTGLLLTSQLSSPFVPVGPDGGIWVNNSGELVFTNSLGDLNLSTAIGGGRTFLDGFLLAGYGFLGAGNPFGGPQSYGVYGSSVNSYVDPGPPPASITWNSDVEGPFQNLAVGASVSSEAWISTMTAMVRRDQRFKALFKFQVTSPAHTNERLFIGFTDDPTTQVQSDDPINEYMGLRQTVAGFNLEFVARGSGGPLAPVFAIPTDTAVHYLEIDCINAGGDVTFRVLASDGETVEATYTAPASLLLPSTGTATYPFIGIFTDTGATPRGIDFYFSSIVTRADIINAVTGGGSTGIPTLSEVLTSGNTTGGTPILVDSSVEGDGIFLLLRGGMPGTASPGQIAIGASSGDNGGNIQLIAGLATGAAGNGGAFQVAGGDGSGTGAGGSFQLVGGNGGIGGGNGGVVQIASGGGIGVNGAGGALQLNAGFSSGTSAGGNVEITAGIGGIGAGTGNGGQVIVSGATAAGSGLPGGVSLLAASASAPLPGLGNIQAVSSPHLADALSSGNLVLDRATSLLGSRVILQAGRGATGSGAAAGSVTIRAQSGDGAGAHGPIHILGDNAVPAAFPTGGEIQIIGRTATGLGAGGHITVFPGTSLAGGFVSIQGGIGDTGDPGGSVLVAGGAGTGIGTGGVSTVRGGAGGATGNGGNAVLEGGTAIGGANTGGNVRLVAGTGPGGNGQISVEGKIDPASPGYQYGVYTVPLPGTTFIISFNAVFATPPTSVTYSIESSTPVASIIVPASVLAGSFTVTTAAGLAPGDLIRWTAVL